MIITAACREMIMIAAESDSGGLGAPTASPPVAGGPDSESGGPSSCRPSGPLTRTGIIMYAGAAAAAWPGRPAAAAYQ